MISYTFMILLTIFMVLYAISIFAVITHDNPYKGYITCLLVAAFPPFILDGCVTMTRHYEVAEIGYSILYISMDMMLFFLLRFVMYYCDIPYRRKAYTMIFRLLCLFDCISVAFNYKFHHVYTIRVVDPSELAAVPGGPGSSSLIMNRIFYGVSGEWYYYVHGALCTFAVLLGIAFLLWKASRYAAIYWVKYYCIAGSLLVTALWYIGVMVSNSPVDASLIGYGITGLLIVFFTTLYKPATLINSLLSASIRSSESGIVLFDNTGRVVFINHSFADLFGIADSDYGKAYDIFKKLTENEESINNSYSAVKRITDEETGIDTIYEIDVCDVYDSRHDYCGFYAKIKDRTDEEVELEKERFLAMHDSLTGLYNINSLYRFTDEKLARKDCREYVAVVTNITGFKSINEVFGTDRADDVLKDIAGRFSEMIGPAGIVGRITGDRFGIFLKKDDFDPVLFTRICRSLYIDRGDYKYPVTMQVGVCNVDAADLTSQMVYDRAFLSIDGIKNDMQKVIAYYDDSVRESILWEQMVTGSVDDAMEAGEIIPFIQAQVASDGKVSGGECLIRWDHRTKGMLPPGKFIGVLEKTGLIARVDRYMWEYACKIIGRWNEEGYEDMYLSVNISPRDFYFTDVYGDITGYAGKYGIRPEQLRLEITETAMMGNVETVLEVIRRLRNDGFIVEMDDFGCGYSSLNTLKILPVDVLKVDMMFLRDIKDADTLIKSRFILSNVINMAIDIGISVITEGVETEEQKAFLEECGCHNFQGYYFSKPIPVSEFEEKYLKGE
ncbi:MAG: GGDEF domain-containing protein [Lachnospiraceae bacterium]|nr:GGDEF domain-containing protein [Lachnospiraceae bacterium]